ncbi:MerR family transcriptional regulator [candidate division FCPU426 bacterium]|nr:MerR family transcriptional regulator [candidate division FCPU426 bacterium]
MPAAKKKRQDQKEDDAKVYPEKMFYQIREVSEMTGVKSHVLRYWETEFPQLRPDKGSTGQRIYRAKDLNLIKRIKALLYDERFTIAGAKQRLGSESRPNKVQMDLKLGLRENHLLNTIHRVKRELETILQMLNRP